MRRLRGGRRFTFTTVERRAVRPAGLASRFRAIILWSETGRGAIDGEIQFTQRWDVQHSADPAPGYTNVDGSCISICVVGDFDKTTPTPTQIRRLEQLVQTLQERFRIPSAQVWVFDYAQSPAGAGRFFPSSAFATQLLR